ncbi:class I SAM-dependent methyltransferase [Paenibacillus xylaniclasticus]|uniref:class I SAM-dependent methyltransferase n=1 Tax=Paenibacillus xylaniclasticus TaxID=588083 RepID=UPI000FD84E45|nr:MULTISPECIES: SAM-dependent methyltransferase [Paenibacillus]GFN30378.1 SAM-dependent methyltransferase [Paenibacillus curdlanolyticus]
MDGYTDSLTARIVDAIHKEGTPAYTEDGTPCLAITFSRYMELCLYDERFGYYRSGGVRTGRNGDFYTSGAIGGVMGKMWARFLHNVSAQADKPPVMIEWAAGAGAMTAALLTAWSDYAPEWLRSIDYWAVDDHPQHLESTREKIQSILSSNPEVCPVHITCSAEAIDRLAVLSNEKTVFIAANELIDAMPVHRVVMRNGQLAEMGVCIQSKGGVASSFGYAYMPLSTPELAISVAEDGVSLAEGQLSEVNLSAERWLAELGSVVRSGMLLLADYGHDAEEYRAAHRMQGTLLCYRNHIAHDNPFLVPGKQDITAHVNFTALKRAAERSGWSTAYEATQLQFLLDQGVMELLADHDGINPFSDLAKRNRAVRQLLLSDGMSETFKIIVLTRGGFQLPPPCING